MDHDDYQDTVLRAVQSLRSNRLVFRALQPHDWELYLDLMAQDPVAFALHDPNLFRPPGNPMSREQFLQATSCPLAVVICFREDDHPIGILTLGEWEGRDRSRFSHRHRSNLQLSILISIEHEGNGFGTEAIKWALDWAFNHAGVHTVSAEAFEYNMPAVGVYEKADFVYEGRLRERHFYDHHWWDILLFSITELD